MVSIAVLFGLSAASLPLGAEGDAGAADAGHIDFRVIHRECKPCRLEDALLTRSAVGAIDCGRAVNKASTKDAADCVSKAERDRKPFKVLSVSFGSVSAELRASLPLANAFELSCAFRLNWLLLRAGGFGADVFGLGDEVALARYDSSGAWLLQAQVPLTAGVGYQDAISNLSGVALMDDLAAWSVLAARDQKVGKAAHLRLGLGYRNRPGILVLQSFGPVLARFDVYWRF